MVIKYVQLQITVHTILLKLKKCLCSLILNANLETGVYAYDSSYRV